MSLSSYLQAVPKAELHVHLEGSIRPATLLQLAENNGVSLPVKWVEGLNSWFSFTNFEHFVQVYALVCRCLRTREDYELIVYELAAELARQNCRYAEVTFSASSQAARGISHDTYFAGLSRGRARAEAEFGVVLNWVFDIVRDYKDPETLHRLADYTVGAAIEGKDEGVMALGLGGNEMGNPAGPFAPYFRRALAAGLHSTPHAGETEGPHSVWSALHDLGAERIGHGVRAIEDPELVSYLAEHKIPLEVCPTSNLRLKIYPGLPEHPLRRLRDAGVVVTVNSDDPPLFNTTLNGEVEVLASGFGYGVDEIDEILLNTVRSSFLPPERKAALEETYRAEMAVLREVHLGRS